MCAVRMPSICQPPNALPTKSSTIAEERQIPQTGNVEIVPHVEIGWTTFLAQVLWKRLIGFRARTFVRNVSILLAQR